MAPLGLGIGCGLAATRLAALSRKRLYRVDELWVRLAEGPDFDDYLSGVGQHAEQALRRLADRLRARRGVASG